MQRQSRTRFHDSGVPWIGTIPATWELIPLKRLGRFESGENITAESIDVAGQYPVYGGNGLRGYTESYSHEGDYVLVGRQGALCGNVNYASGKFWASEHAVTVKPTPEVAVQWLGELLRAMNLGQYSQSAAQPGLSVEFVINLKVPVPPPEEQQAIAVFLDRKTAQIDAVVAKKQRLIERLQEKRQALISHAVTKGLDPHAPMKDSGIEWLKEVPAHWMIRRFRHCGTIPNGQVDPRLPAYRDMVLIAPNHIESESGRLLLTETAFEQGAESGKYIAQEGDVIYSKIRPELQKACIAPERCLCSADMYPITPKSDMVAEYILYNLLCDWFTKYAVLWSDRVAMPKVNRETFGNCFMVVPPLDEQREIVRYIKVQTEHINSMTDRTRTQIGKLQEYRQTLISAAVTGKLDVTKEAGV